MLPSLMSEALSTFAYAATAGVLLLTGFGILDLLTPGKLSRLVYVDHHYNACVVAGAQQVALGIIIVTGVYQSDDTELWQGLVELAVFGLVGILIQAIALIILEALIPGRFRDLVEDPKPRSSSWVVGALLVVAGAINAACLI